MSDVIVIYIPIWIDLKVSAFLVISSTIFYLHSNMDRFESGLSLKSSLTRVYLHSNMDRFESVLVSMIPAGVFNLHSNMDRFERKS